MDKPRFIELLVYVRYTFDQFWISFQFLNKMEIINNKKKISILAVLLRLKTTQREDLKMDKSA